MMPENSATTLLLLSGKPATERFAKLSPPLRKTPTAFALTSISRP